MQLDQEKKTNTNKNQIILKQKKNKTETKTTCKTKEMLTNKNGACPFWKRTWKDCQIDWISFVEYTQCAEADLGLLQHPRWSAL